MKWRREKAHAREANAELSKLTLRAQHAVTAQRKLGNGRLADIYDALIQVALNGASEHACVAASKLLLDLARAAVEENPTDPDKKPLEEMTPAERIALFVRLDERLARLDEEEASEQEDAPGGERTSVGRPRGRENADPPLTRSP